jgi:hypothetical protein
LDVRDRRQPHRFLAPVLAPRENVKSPDEAIDRYARGRFDLSMPPVTFPISETNLSSREPRGLGKPIMGAAFVGIGTFVLTGLDRIVEASVTRAMPDWLVTVTTRL